MKIKYLYNFMIAVALSFLSNSYLAQTNATNTVVWNSASTTGPTNAEINAALLGSNVAITNPVLNYGNRLQQIATFSGGTAANLGMNTGVFFGTGLNSGLLTLNTAAVTSGNPTGTGSSSSDADLVQLVPNATFNTVSYSFTITTGPKATTLNIKYQFGSEEYPNFVGSQYNDAFGFFVSGGNLTSTQNIGRLPNGNTTSINNVNIGIPGSNASNPPTYDASQSSLYINNGHPTTTTGTGTGVRITTYDNSNYNGPPVPVRPIGVQFNGITNLLTYTLGGLLPNTAYTFKVVIADAGDNQYDSGLFINTIYGTATLVANNDTYSIISGNDSATSVLLNDSVNGTSNASLSDVTLSQVSTSNSGVNLNTATGLINVAPGTPAGVYTVNYRICDLTYLENCKTAVATVTVLANDPDGDGIDSFTDLDDDNDGILDCVEKGFGPNSSVSTIFKLNGSASQLATNEIRLTPDAGNQSGNAWSYGKVDFAKSFTISYSAYFGTKDAAGADGITTVFHNFPLGVNATGGTGGSIGVPGIANGIVLEIDTYNNGTGVGDIANDHGQIWVSSNQNGAGLLTTATDLGNVEDGLYHNIVVNWNFATKTLSYTLDGINAGIYTFPAGTPITSYFGGVSKVYFGYTASTGAFSNDQRIRFNSFCSDLPLELDSDNDGTPNHLDVDSDNDGCADALEGSEFVRRTHIHSLSLATTDTNYPYRGQIKVTYNGTTTGTPAQIISASTGANGVPQLVNVAGSNLSTTTNPSNLAGISDNTDGTADIGQNFGSSQDALTRDPDCDRCFRPATTAGTTLPTNHGITALARAGGNAGEWPVRVNGAYTVLDAKTKGFVINRVPTSALTSITGVTGMMVYDTTVNCLKIYDGTSWNCYTKQTCNDSNP